MYLCRGNVMSSHVHVTFVRNMYVGSHVCTCMYVSMLISLISVSVDRSGHRQIHTLGVKRAPATVPHS